jgi:2-polyprenyl-3-methyl-5-hydroxy-6-metoxy-1,4-benzoquinol methylase
VGRSGRLSVLRDGALLSPRIPQQSGSAKWLPALDGVVDKLERGAKVADVVCGDGWSTMSMAQAFPHSQFVGYDYHPSSIEHARAHVNKHGVSANTRFEVGAAKDYAKTGFDLVGFFDRLHDRGDPAGAAGHVRQSLKPDVKPER